MERRSFLRDGLVSLAVGSSTQPQADTRETNLNTEITRILDLVKQIRPGDLRQSLARSWKQDGGIQIASTTRYLLQACDMIQISIDFRQVDVTRPFDNPDDIITRVSKPYLQYRAYD